MKSPSSDTDRRDLVGALRKGLTVMEILAENPAGLTLTEMADRAGLTRAGARRLLLTLVDSGYAQPEGRRFILSPRLISVARAWVSSSSLWSFAEPFMRQVSQALNESCSAAVLADEDVVYVARVAGRRILSVALNVGTRLPAHCTSMGRVLLSDLAPRDLDTFLQRATIRQHTPKTLTSKQDLASAIVEAGERGYALVDEELELGLRSIAVPIRDRTGRIVAAINVSTQTDRLTTGQMQDNVLSELKLAAAAIQDYFLTQ